MTAFDYSRAVATANRLIARFGQAGTLRRPISSGPAYNPSPSSPDDFPCRFVVTEYSAREIDGTRILATDKRVYLSAYGLETKPKLSDLLLDADEKPYKIVAVLPLKPASTVLFYEMQVRR